MQHYSASFNRILHETTTPLLQEHFHELDGIESWEAIESKLERMMLPLIKSNIEDFFRINFLYSILTRG